MLVWAIRGRTREMVVRAIADHGELQLIGDTVSPVGLLLSANALTPDVVIVPLDDHNNFPGICSHLMGERSDLTIIGISEVILRAWSGVDDGGHGAAIAFSVDALLATIRGRAGRRPV